MYGMMFLSWLPMIPASMVVLFLFVAINVIYRAVSTPPGLPKDGNGVCGACNYQLGTLAGHRCPECGADLLRCGVITRWMLLRARGSTAGAIAAWSVLMFSTAGTALAVWGAVVMVQNAVGNMTINPDYIQVQWIGPATEWDPEARAMTGDDLRVGVEYTTSNLGVPVNEAKEYRILIEQASVEWGSIEIGKDGSWVLKDQKGKKLDDGEEISIELIDRLFGLLATPIPDDRARAYADQGWVYVQAFVGMGDMSAAWTKLNTVSQQFDEDVRMAHAGSRATPVGGVGGMMMPSMPFAVWAPVFYSFIGMMVVYIAGVVFIVRRRTKLMRG